ncbi:MAG: DUF4419 domain-containing protein [Bacteroidales bacterium]|nr:DUF4419 domain-containing protein [Bacteroidales bacterium]
MMLKKTNVLIVFLLLTSLCVAKQIIKCDKCKENRIEYSMVSLSELSKQTFNDDIATYLQVTSNTVDSLVSVEDIHNANNMFMTMIGVAFANHYPIELSPDDIWLMIIAGVEQHIINNREKYKYKFVLPESDTSIIMINNELSTNSNESTWDKAVIELFNNLSLRQPKETFELLDAKFSTSNIVDGNVIKTRILGMSSTYFSYELITLCGIPKIIVLGEKSDWENLRSKYLKLVNYFEMNWWAAGLEPVLSQFVNVYDNKIDHKFWNGIYKYHESNRSGEVNGVNGWITAFFPYIDNVKRKEWNKTIEENKFPYGFSEFEIKWNNIGDNRTLFMRTGFIGIQASKKDNLLKATRGYILIDVTDLKRKQ